MNNEIKAYLLKHMFTVKQSVPVNGNIVKDITPSFEEYDKNCGTYGSDFGKLAELFPEEFSPEAVNSAEPSTSHSYGSSCIAISYVSDLVYYYSEEKHCFSEFDAFRLAEEAGKEFLIMENLS